MNLKFQKSNLLTQIDEEIKKAPEYSKIYLKIPEERKNHSEEFWNFLYRRDSIEIFQKKEEKTQVDFKKTEFVTFKLSAGTQYKIVKSKEALTIFKNKIKKDFFLVKNIKSKSKIEQGFFPTVSHSEKIKLRTIRPTLEVTRKQELDFEYKKPYKPAEVTIKNYNLYEGINFFENWFANKHYMIKGHLAEKIKKRVTLFSPQLITKELMASLLDCTGFKQAKIESEEYGYGDDIYKVLFQEGDIKIFLDAKYVDLIFSYHSEAIPFIKEKEHRVLFKVKNEIVAICMEFLIT